MITGDAIDQLSCNPHAISGLADAAFENVAHTKLARYVANVDALALEHERRVPGGHGKSRYLRQIRGNVLTDAIAEIFLLGIAAHVRKRQDTDRNALPSRACRLGLRN